jgi:secreted PhoX family phosphatase
VFVITSLIQNQTKNMKRRSFIEFLGKGSLVSLAVNPLLMLNACKPGDKLYEAKVLFESLNTLEVVDDVVLVEGFDYHVVVSAGDAISDKDTFGEHCDFNALFPMGSNNDEAILWTNNEYYNRVTLGTSSSLRTKVEIDKERYAVGGSITKIKKNAEGKWTFVKDNEINKRITGETKIPFHWDEEIRGSKIAEGTLQNCSGGVTPWGTVLTCEENYDGQYGEITYENGEREFIPSYYQWEKHYNNPPEHYGWVVEVNIQTGEAQKLVSMGRCKHECATVFELEDGRVVVYSGDDEANQFIYKYVSKHAKDLKEGTLYVADVINGKWLALDYNNSELLQSNFEDQTAVLVRARDAAKLLGASPMNRPEDIKIDPISGDVFVSLTNNKAIGDYHGSILKIVEGSADKTGVSFNSETFLMGGIKDGFSSPDNLVFDKKGNFWFATDVSGSSLGMGEYAEFLSNGIFVVPRSGERQGEVIQVASAPVAAEFTGLCFHPDGKTLFVSVQHPGETSKDLDNLTSHWPLGRNAIPKSSVIAITGNFL